MHRSKVEKINKKRSNVGASGSNTAGVAAGASQRSRPNVAAGASQRSEPNVAAGACGSNVNKGKGIAVDDPGSKKKKPRKKVINLG